MFINTCNKVFILLACQKSLAELQKLQTFHIQLAGQQKYHFLKCNFVLLLIVSVSTLLTLNGEQHTQ